ncbi:FAD:protein FMN transferase [Gracilinema caldarium]|nr:FAD:protein FMN transferase [Gracilinema caldarium]
MKRTINFIILLGSALIFVSCTKPMPAQTEYVLGTLCTINLFDKGSSELYRTLFTRLREIENHMSVNKEGTELDRINTAAGRESVHVTADVVEVLAAALRYAELSDGAFDPTVGPLVKLWGIGSDNARVPKEHEIVHVLPLINWKDVVLDVQAKTVFLKRPGMALDLGAIAKGYAADEMARILKSNKVERAIIDLGGNVLAYGEKQGGKAWRIGIQDPTGERGAYVGILEIKNKTMVTSGVYERFLLQDGIRYHHILSTQTGYPVQNGLLSVTIIGDHSIDADGLSTTVFALGYEKGRALLESLGNVEGIFIFEDGSLRATSGARSSFSLTSDNYRWAD